MRGYFGIGVEGITKPANAGALFRSAHAFGAQFIFTIAKDFSKHRGAAADTSDAAGSVPLYEWPGIAEMVLPSGCKLVGVELVDEAIPLPSFRHPLIAAYVLGRERGNISPELLERCDFVVRIPTSFCINVATAGAIVMYDRTLCYGRFGERPVAPGTPVTPPPAHVHGGPLFRSKR
jgi:tRNA G18 (ribose-2'-O)-methylase SpoU